MGTTEDLADKLAADVIAAMDEIDDDELATRVSEVIGASSTTTQEAFLTAMRVRLSEARARKYLEDRLAKARAERG
ncbi:MAG: hypothetical protein AAGA12_08830 [Pseudomonadota bacterium]